VNKVEHLLTEDSPCLEVDADDWKEKIVDGSEDSYPDNI
jgi:hypothetical protein